MPRSRSKGILGGLLLAGAALLACSDKGTEPKSAGSNIYIGGTYWTDPYDEASVVHNLYVLDADSLVISDSISLRSRALGISASPDGRWLYVWESGHSYSTAPRVSKIDNCTKQYLWSRDGFVGPLTILKNGELLVARSSHDAVLRTTDGMVVRNFPDSLRLWHGPISGSAVAAIAEVDSGRVCVVDVVTGRLSGSYLPRLRTGQPVSAKYAVLHPDGRRALVLARASVHESWFVVGDLRTGETLLEHGLVYPFGEIAISANGATAVVTDPGQALIGDSRPTMDVFDLRTLKHLGRLTLSPFPTMPSQVRFLPGDRRVVTAEDPAWYSEGPLAFFDVSSMRLEDTVWIYRRDYPKIARHALDGLGAGPRAR